MIRNNVEDLPQVTFSQALAKSLMGLLAAQLLVYSVVIHHVVSVTAPRSRLQIGRRIDMAYS
jgi:hypothetical protein